MSQEKNMQLSSKFDQALVYASELHRTQVRKGSGVPYISHLLAVSSLVIENGGTEDEAIAALLHDAVEDQGGLATLEKIRQRFGDRVAAIVEGCTDSTADTSKGEVKLLWRQRKASYIAHIPTASASVRLVSAADKLHNARTILNDYQILGEAVWSRFKGGKEGSLWYYRALVQAFQETGSGFLIDQLEQVVNELEHLVAIATKTSNELI